MKLDQVELLHVRRRLAHPFRISLGAITSREFVVLRGRADGLTVYGEANIDSRPFYVFETVGTVWEMISEVLLPPLLGKSFSSIDEECQTWKSIRDHEYAKAAVEHLYWDLDGKMRGQSIQQMLGGHGKTVEVGTSHSIDADTQAFIKDIEAARAQGIKRIKIKVQPGWDETPLNLIREHFGDITLMADANAAYLPEHIDHLAGMDRFEMLMLEQPLPPLDLIHHRELARRLTTPLCLDEGAHDSAMAENAVTLGGLPDCEHQGRTRGWVVAGQVDPRLVPRPTGAVVVWPTNRFGDLDGERVGAGHIAGLCVSHRSRYRTRSRDFGSLCRYPTVRSGRRIRSCAMRAGNRRRNR